MSVRHGMCADAVRGVDCVLLCVRVCANGVSNEVEAILLLAVSAARVIVVMLYVYKKHMATRYE
jgi:hypothetical protein